MTDKSKIAFFSLTLSLASYLPTHASVMLEEHRGIHHTVNLHQQASYNKIPQKEVWVELSTETSSIKDICYALETQTNATHLSLAGRGLEDEALQIIGNFKNLSHLYLEDNSFTDNGVQFLRNLSLKEIDLSGNDITHEGLNFLPLDHLQALYASFLNLNDESFLRKLAAAPKLKELYVAGTELNSKSLQIIEECSTLERLDISYNKKITQEDIQQLKTKRPQLTIFNN